MQKFLDYLKQAPFWALTALKTGLCCYWINLYFTFKQTYNVPNYSWQYLTQMFFEPLRIVIYLGLSIFFTLKLKNKHLWWILLFVAFECSYFILELYARQKGGMDCYEIIQSINFSSSVGGAK